MKKVLAVAAALILLQAASAQGGHHGYGPHAAGPVVVVSPPPLFLYPPELGFGVAVGVPYDIFYISGGYFLYYGGGWYRAPYYGARWVPVPPRGLPPRLHRYDVATIHHFRDREYHVYRSDHKHYHGKTFRPGGHGHGGKKGGSHGGGRGGGHGGGHGRH